MIKKFRVVKEVEADSIPDALKKESKCEACEIYEIEEKGEEKSFIGFKAD